MRTGEKDRTMTGDETDTTIPQDVTGTQEAKESSKTTTVIEGPTETPDLTAGKGKIPDGTDTGTETTADIHEF